MQAASEEERNIVIANNSFYQNVPAITVTLDGEWSKCTHRHNYNAKSGVGIIIDKAKFFLWASVINSALFVREQTTQLLPSQNTIVSRTGVTVLLRCKQTSYFKAFKCVSGNMVSGKFHL